MKTIGIVGGLGTETSCSFCLNINHQIKRRHQVQPHLIMDNVPISITAENIIAKAGHCSEVEELLGASVRRLNQADAHLIVIPCNTVHIYLNQLREISAVPILSIIEETAKACRNFKKVGLLASTTTIKSNLYQRELEKQAIDLLIPNSVDQAFMSDCILRIINLQATSQDTERMQKIIEDLRGQGAQAIILGCTDLFLIVSQQNISVPLINSTAVLENAVVSWLSQENNNSNDNVGGYNT